MGKIVVSLSVSIDGYIEASGRDIGWHLVDDEVHRHFNSGLARAGAFLEGRVTYELMEAFWPTADDDPGCEPAMAEFAQIWRRMPKVVYSRTLRAAGPGAAIVREVVPDEVRELARTHGDLVVGGPSLASAFRRLDLVDEWRVYVHPVVLGEGTPLFAPADGRLRLDLLDTHRFGNGVVLLRYGRSTATAS